MKRLRVVTGTGYPIRFTIDMGQETAAIQRRRLSALRRLHRNGDAIALTLPNYDLLHSWNSVPILPGKPFVVSFEDYLPRVPSDRPSPFIERILRRRLVSPDCKAIIAISRYARSQFIEQHRRWPDLHSALERLVVLPPAVQSRSQSGKELSTRCLRLLAVGKDYMRKGFDAVVRTHQALEERGVPVATTIVSSLRFSPDDYIGPSDVTLYRDAMARLGASSISLRPGASNNEVLQLMDEADFLLFPSLHETYGYVALEAMAGGTPVIAHRTAALPEIVDEGESGWLLELDTDDLGRWSMLYRSDDEHYNERYEDVIRSAASSMTELLTKAWEDRELYSSMSRASADRVRARFSPAALRAALDSIYAGETVLS